MSFFTFISFFQYYMFPLRQEIFVYKAVYSRHLDFSVGKTLTYNSYAKAGR